MGEICVIVGVGPSLGMGLSRKLGGEGSRLTLMSRNAQTLCAAEKELRGAGIEPATLLDAGPTARGPR